MAGLSGAAVTLGSTAYRVSGWWNQPSADSFTVLSESEVEIAGAMADAMFPGEPYVDAGMPNGAEAGVVEHLDQYLGSVDAHSSRLLRLLIHAIDDAAVLSDFRLTRFRHRPREQRIAILKAWDNSQITFRRKAFRSVKLIMAGGYCSHAGVLGAAGIDYQCGGRG